MKVSGMENNVSKIITALLPILKEGPTNNLWTLLAVVEEFTDPENLLDAIDEGEIGGPIYLKKEECLQVLYEVISELFEKYQLKIYDWDSNELPITKEEYLNYYKEKFLVKKADPFKNAHDYYYAV